MEEGFKKWLESIGYVNSTQSNYSHHLREHIPRFLKNINININNIFNIKSIEEVKNILSLFQKGGKLYFINQDQDNYPSSSLKKYIDYLKTLNHTNDKVKIQEIADEAGLSNGDLLKKAKELGFDVKAANSQISYNDANILVDYAISGTLPKKFQKTKARKIVTEKIIKALKNKEVSSSNVNNGDSNSSIDESFIEAIKKNKDKNIFSDKRIKYDFLYKNILLKGVPGTGKSRTLESIINNHLNLKDYYDTNVLRINVHSASSNADLMQGIGISSNDDGHIEYKEKQGLILELIERATFNPNQPFVLVLEEIQENSLNELIGDLIYLIEDSKRASGYEADNEEYTYSKLLDEIMTQNSDIASVKLPSLISKSEKTKRMIIPHNLYIFCTSNYRDDRKVIEDNLLRRFEVIEIYPKYKEEIGDDFISDEVSKFLKELNESIVNVCSNNGEIHPDRFMIGHSIWLEVEDSKAFSRAFLKVITEFKDIKDMHFDDFQKIIKEIKIFGITISIENAASYEVLIKILQNDCYDFLK